MLQTQIDRIESLLIVVLQNQIQLAVLGAKASPNAMGVSAAYDNIKIAAKNAIDFSKAERSVKR